MSARSTYVLACNGDGCQEVFFPPPRQERWVSVLPSVAGHMEVTTVSRLASAVRTEALRAGWSHVFHERGRGQSGPGWYEDFCPTCTTKEPTHA